MHLLYVRPEPQKLDAMFAERFFDLITKLTAIFDGTHVLGSKIAILMALYRAEKDGYLHTLTSLSSELEMPHATMLRHLTEMIEFSWIMRTPHASDRRVNHVRLSPDTIGRISCALES